MRKQSPSLPIKIGGLGFFISRPIQSFSQNHLGGIDRSEYQYRFNSDVLKMRMQHQGITEIYDYAYDHVGRKTSFKHTKDGVSQNVAKYEYDAIGRMKTKIFKPAGSAVGSKQTGNWTDVNTWLSGFLPTISDNVTINSGHTVTIPTGQNVSAGSLFDKGILQNFGTLQMGNLNPNSGGSDLEIVNYSYKIRGGLQGINLDNGGNLTNKIFSMRLGYEDAGFYDGNIGKQEWKSSLDNVSRSFTYGYDGASRITQGTYGGGKPNENYSLNFVTYDFNGNITNLSRNGLKSNNTFGLIDNLDYTYQANSNKIQEVTDKSGETASFADATGATDYTYSLDGSLTSDNNKGISIMEYNYLKLPRRIVKNGVEILYQYDALGKKLKETIGSNFTDYNGNTVYKNGALYQISHDEGRIINGEYEYNIKDHLGNLRVAFRDSLGFAKIVQANSYGIWGESLPTLSYLKASWKQDNFRFTGKENLPETGYTDFGARFYDNIVPRFITQDIKSEKWNMVSPYSYALNNPLIYIDPDGMDIDVSELLKSKDHAEAFIIFAKTKEGNAFLSNYASKGQKLQYNGNVFFEAKSAGKYDKLGIGLNYNISSDKNTTGSSTTSGEGIISKDINIEISSNGFGSENKKFNLVDAITHESLLHANSHAEDMDDGKKNHSNLPSEYRQYGTHADHYYVSREFIGNSNNKDVQDFPVNGFSILKQASKQLELNYSDTKIKTIMWNFNGSLINVNPKNGKLSYPK